jgi:hypothetical protein
MSIAACNCRCCRKHRDDPFRVYGIGQLLKKEDPNRPADYQKELDRAAHKYAYEQVAAIEDAKSVAMWRGPLINAHKAGASWEKARTEKLLGAIRAEAMAQAFEIAAAVERPFTIEAFRAKLRLLASEQRDAARAQGDSK